MHGLVLKSQAGECFMPRADFIITGGLFGGRRGHLCAIRALARQIIAAIALSCALAGFALAQAPAAAPPSSGAAPEAVPSPPAATAPSPAQGAHRRAEPGGRAGTAKFRGHRSPAAGCRASLASLRRAKQSLALGHVPPRQFRRADRHDGAGPGLARHLDHLARQKH